MNKTLPTEINEFMLYSWEDIKPFFLDLKSQQLSETNVDQWLADWNRLQELLSETFSRLYVSTTIDTTDAQAEQRYNRFLDDIYPHEQAAHQQLKEKLLASGLTPKGFDIPLRNMRADAELFRSENLALLTEELKLNNEYDKIIGAQTILWDGEEVTLEQLRIVYQESDRSRREQAWRTAAKRQQEDRQKINQLWTKYLNLRIKLAENARHPDYRSYRWQQLLRFDYNPEDAIQFDLAIERIVVPVAERIYERRRKRLGIDQLRPWDLVVDRFMRPPLKPFEDIGQFTKKATNIFKNVDPVFGAYFESMQESKLLDLENRKGKAPGGYCESFSLMRRPFIFMNAVGIHDDAQTLLHEGGHAFHVFETAELPYLEQRKPAIEFAEVASMAMEFLSAPYLTEELGGFYDQAEASRARIEHLENSILFWPYMAVVDLFQHWVYENEELARETSNCDRYWEELWDRFMVGVDWSGLEDEKQTGWQRKLHIHEAPFYYIEYGLAQLGALQVYQNAIKDKAQAVNKYRKALSLGCTATLPDLFATSGARFSLDDKTLQQTCKLAEDTILALEENTKAL